MKRIVLKMERDPHPDKPLPPRGMELTLESRGIRCVVRVTRMQRVGRGLRIIGDVISEKVMDS